VFFFLKRKKMHICQRLQSARSRLRFRRRGEKLRSSTLKFVGKILQLHLVIFWYRAQFAITNFRQVMAHHHFESRSSKRKENL